MFDIILDPVKAIEGAKGEHSAGRVSFALLVASLLASCSVFLIFREFSPAAAIVAAAIFLGMIVDTLFISFLQLLGLFLLSGKGGYLHALASVTYGFFVLSVGFFVSLLIRLIPASGILAQIINALMFILLAATIIWSTAIAIRTAAELFDTDLFTVVAAKILTYLGIFLAALFVTLSASPALFGNLSGDLWPLWLPSDANEIKLGEKDIVPLEQPFGSIVTEFVTCTFPEHIGEQECFSEKGQCFGTGSSGCTVIVQGTHGERITWKSTLCGYASSVIDGLDESIAFAEC